MPAGASEVMMQRDPVWIAMGGQIALWIAVVVAAVVFADTVAAMIESSLREIADVLRSAP